MTQWDIDYVENALKTLTKQDRRYYAQHFHDFQVSNEEEEQEEEEEEEEEEVSQGQP